MGGLGNQLFQIATTYALSLTHRVPCGFDLNNNTLPLQGRPAYEYNRTLYMTLPKIKHSDYNLIPYKEKTWEYAPIKFRDNIILDGYFQSPKYFGSHKSAIIDLFLNLDVVYGILNRLRDDYTVELYHSVSLHIRRGDYLRFPNHHPQPSMGYYMTAVQQIRKKRDVRCILVFSDDIPWCKKELRSPEIRFIEGLQDYEDMLLMSLCNANVISNSSFSWWASYFNQNADKMVYAPKTWFGKAIKHGWQDIYTSDMIIL
jgi:hypothetical protein